MFQTEETVSIRMDISDYSKEDLFNLIGLFQKYIDNCKISFHDDSFDKLRNKSSDKIILNFIIKADGLQELNNGCPPKLIFGCGPSKWLHQALIDVYLTCFHRNQ